MSDEQNKEYEAQPKWYIDYLYNNIREPNCRFHYLFDAQRRSAPAPFKQRGLN